MITLFVVSFLILVLVLLLDKFPQHTNSIWGVTLVAGIVIFCYPILILFYAITGLYLKEWNPLEWKLK